MAFAFYIFNYSTAIETIDRARNKLIHEFRKWGYRVSNTVEDAETVDVLLLSESQMEYSLNEVSKYALVITNQEILENKYSFCDANKLWPVPYPIVALLVSGSTTDNFNITFQCSPMCFVQMLNVNDYINLVAYLVNRFSRSDDLFERYSRNNLVENF